MFRVSLLSCLGRWALGFLAIGLLEKAASNVGIPISSPFFTLPLHLYHVAQGLSFNLSARIVTGVTSAKRRHSDFARFSRSRWV